jgi:hypothetical protein
MNEKLRMENICRAVFILLALARCQLVKAGSGAAALRFRHRFY